MKTQAQNHSKQILNLIAISLMMGTTPVFGGEKLSIHPIQATAGTYQKIQFEFTSDLAEIAVGGSIRIELPVAYLETKSYYWDQPQIELIEIVKLDGKEYRTIYSDKPASRISMFQFTDQDFAEDSMYYVRVRQVDEIWRSNWAYGNAEMAWSSPIWVNCAK